MIAVLLALGLVGLVIFIERALYLHRVHAGFCRVLITFCRMRQRTVVLAVFPMTTGSPEMGQSQHPQIRNLALQRKHQIEVGERALNVFLMHPHHALGHQNMHIVDDPQCRAAPLGKTAQPVLHRVHFAPARIHPLSHVTKQRGCVRIRRVQTARCGPVFVEPRHAAANPAQPEVAPQLIQQICAHCQCHAGSSVPDYWSVMDHPVSWCLVGQISDLPSPIRNRLFPRFDSVLPGRRLTLPLQALCEKYLEQRLVWNVPAICQYFEILDHVHREPQRYRLQGRFELNQLPALSGWPIEVLRRIRGRPESPFVVFVLEFRKLLLHISRRSLFHYGSCPWLK